MSIDPAILERLRAFDQEQRNQADKSQKEVIKQMERVGEEGGDFALRHDLKAIENYALCNWCPVCRSSFCEDIVHYKQRLQIVKELLHKL